MKFGLCIPLRRYATSDFIGEDTGQGVRTIGL